MMMKKAMVFIGVFLLITSTLQAGFYAVYGGSVSGHEDCQFHFIVIYDDKDTPEVEDDVRVASDWISECQEASFPKSAHGLIQNEKNADDSSPRMKEGTITTPDNADTAFSTLSEGMTLYLDPTAQQLKIEIDNVALLSGFITNSVGAIVANLSFEFSSNTVDVSYLSPGTYILRILGDDDNVYMKQFVVE